MQGVRCNCGKTVKPGFAIAKNKVKVVGSKSTTINLGPASGNSLSNLFSSSDLGKYPTATGINSYGTHGSNANRSQEDHGNVTQ